MLPISPVQRSRPPRIKRYKTLLACSNCRRSKLKCDGGRPVCSRCREKTRLHGSCEYVTGSSSFTAPSQQLEFLAANEAPLYSTTNSCPSSNADVPVDPDVRTLYAEPDQVGFASKVTAAIDVRLGLPIERERCPIPLTDAPLFCGELSRQHKHDDNHSDNVLPPRKHADQLVNLYWRYIDPFEPLLDRESFNHSYQLLLDGKELDCDERNFVCTLNAIFALATQLQETIPSQQRSEASTTFVHRAWSLLRPENILWEAGSVETVQCLLLIARYLQCTANLQKTWMAVGAAVRMAQGLGLQLSADPSFDHQYVNGRIARQIWQCCVSMDRILSWTLGRTTMISLTSCSFLTNVWHGDPQGDIAYQLVTKMSELNEITNFIMLSQVLARNSFADKLGLPILSKAYDPSAIMQIENCLDRLETSHESLILIDTSLTSLQQGGKNSQEFLFKIRLAHARILLFRPSLVRLCLTSFAPGVITQKLDNRLLREFARICVENAELMINLVIEDSKFDAGTGILPWWWRVFYLWISTLHIIAAMMRPDLFEPSVSDHWNKAISAICAHEHLSSFVPRCISSFRSMWEKVTVIQQRPSQAAPDSYQDVFEQLIFQSNDLMFNIGVDDLDWLGNLEWEANKEDQ